MRGHLLLSAFTLAGGAALLLLGGPGLAEDLLGLTGACLGQAGGPGPEMDLLRPLRQGGWLLLRAVALLGAGVLGAGVLGARLLRRWLPDPEVGAGLETDRDGAVPWLIAPLVLAGGALAALLVIPSPAAADPGAAGLSALRGALLSGLLLCGGAGALQVLRELRGR